MMRDVMTIKNQKIQKLQKEYEQLYQTRTVEIDLKNTSKKDI